MYKLYAICRNVRCDNNGAEFSRSAKKATYQSTHGPTRQRTDVSCPLCLCWAKITKIEEVA